MLKMQSWFPEMPGVIAQSKAVQKAMIQPTADRQMDSKKRTGHYLMGIITELWQNFIFKGFSKKKNYLYNVLSFVNKKKGSVFGLFSF